MTNDIYQDIVGHFSDENRKNTVLEIKYNYDLTVDEGYIQIEKDTDAVYQAAKDLELKYTAESRHRYTTEGEETVDVLWKFWK